MGMNVLPESCIAKILSLTSPRDACRLSSVSRIFRSAAESDDVWNKFLPPELPAEVPEYPSRKDLFFGLSNDPLLIHQGRMSFSLERSSGKKCYMISPRALRIAWGDDPRYWRWISLPDSRFEEVAELDIVWWFDISGRMDTSLLSDNTLYGAYLVFDLTPNAYGFREAVESTVKTADNIQHSRVYLSQNPRGEGGSRRDGWSEAKLGCFFNGGGGGDEGEVEIRLCETRNLHAKEGLIVHGIEIRPSSS
ncbi:PREDICTED: F-box protein PP2-B11-like [Tarenaya hassleriana]|uniref:F-box protein PP2-B11-like n=1 Tax=Tarenaya hassleriana TaxID=28532 RepID=UPI00053C346B|nr:PREDICTED: F-box protein PP2-B11-like [Tarenaya hassleriana]